MLSYETMRKVALGIVQLGRDVPEEERFEDAEHYAVSLIRRLVEEAYDEGRQGELSSLGEAEVTPGADPLLRTGIVAVRRPKLLDRKPVLVRSDVLMHRLEPRTLDALRQAIERGLVPSSLDFTGDDESIAILRFTRPRAGEARLMVGVEFCPEDNEVVGKVYDAESQLKYATEPRDAHLAGSVRATVSRLLRELAAKVGGDPSF